MSRYISKLPPEIRELAEKRRSEQPDYTPIEQEDYLPYAFNWDDTPEKSGFWRSIRDSNYSVFYTLYQQKDKLDEVIFWKNDNGIFADFETVKSWKPLPQQPK